ncbi:MAG: copper-translocating P-type ATPase [Candidatus Harrisonbacteria bacterium]|nr:copper-translocating P-type ATPase [Candidatus Harrisonbacteria bacterium]
MDHGCHSTPAQGNHSNHHQMMVDDFKKRFWISLPLSLPILALTPLIQSFFGFSFDFSGSANILVMLSVVIFFYGGWPFLSGLYSELKKGQPGMMTLIGVAISAAFLYSMATVFGLEGEGLFWELATLIVIMLLGHWIEMRSVLGASRALEELSRLLPSTVHKIHEQGDIEDVPIESLMLSDRILVRPGERVPVDGSILKGMTTVNEALLTGETKPSEKKEGDSVIGGSINGDGAIEVEVKKLGKDSYVAQIIALVEKAQGQKSKTQNVANRAAKWLTIVALSVGTLTLFLWLFFSARDFAYALERTIAVIVIACPHALGLAVPLVVSFSTSISARRGLLIRNRTAFENARNLDAIVFDKTGTLTEGTFEISDLINFSDEKEQDLLDIAGSLESHSEHPIARAIAEKAKTKQNIEAFKALPGKGVEATIGGKGYKVVSPGFLTEQNISFEKEKVSRLSSEGKTIVYLLRENTVLAAIALDDKIREEARRAIETIQSLGIKAIMLTGDSEAVAGRVAKELGIDEFFAEVLPEKKSEKIMDLQKQGRVVAMVGDGVNDAPALTQADVGIAIGAGTDVAIESADIVLVKNNPEDVALVINLGQKTYRKMVQNLWWASGYNIAAIPLAAGALAWAGIVLSPAIGAVLMTLSTVIVAFNATLLKWQLR